MTIKTTENPKGSVNRRSFLKLVAAGAATAASSKLTACAPISPEENSFMALPDVINNKEALNGELIETNGYIGYEAGNGSYHYAGFDLNGKIIPKTAFGIIYNAHPEPQETTSYLRVFVPEGIDGQDLLPTKRQKFLPRLGLIGSLRSDDLGIIWGENEKENEKTTFLIVSRIYEPGIPTSISSPTK